MQIYLAARYSRHPEMRGCRDVLQTMLGHTVTSRWIDCHTDVVGDFTASFTREVLNARPHDCAPLGQHDLDDIDAADCVISFTDPDGGGKGGRHWEGGYALARGKRMIVVGQREHVFHTLAGIEWFPDWPALVIGLANERNAARAEAAEARCTHELLPGQCAQCAPPSTRRAPSHPAERRPSASRPFPAAYEGECGECGGGIEEGDMIRMSDGAPIHDECWEDPR